MRLHVGNHFRNVDRYVRPDAVVRLYKPSRNDCRRAVASAYCLRDVRDLRIDGHDDGRFKGIGRIARTGADCVGGSVRFKAFIYRDGLSNDGISYLPMAFRILSAVMDSYACGAFDLFHSRTQTLSFKQ